MNAAWAQLVNWDGSDEFLSLCDEALAEVREGLATQIRTATLNEASDYLIRHGYADSAYLLRSTDAPTNKG